MTWQQGYGKSGSHGILAYFDNWVTFLVSNSTQTIMIVYPSVYIMEPIMTPVCGNVYFVVLPKNFNLLLTVQSLPCMDSSYLQFNQSYVHILLSHTLIPCFYLSTIHLLQSLWLLQTQLLRTLSTIEWIHAYCLCSYSIIMSN